MRKRKDMEFALKKFFKEVRIPSKLIADKAEEQVLGESRKLCELSSCKITELERGSPASNHTERYTGIIKNETKRDLLDSDSPLLFWCYALERRMKIINATPRDNYLQEGECPHSRMTGQPCDISAYCNFGWYEWVKFRHHGVQFPYPTERLGRCLGPSDDADNVMCQYILADRGTVITPNSC